MPDVTPNMFESTIETIEKIESTIEKIEKIESTIKKMRVRKNFAQRKCKKKFSVSFDNSILRMAFRSPAYHQRR